MAVVIDEMVTEAPPETGGAAAETASGGGSKSAELDMGRFDFEMGRRLHRAARLSAD
jgi:hypothetical protein